MGCSIFFKKCQEVDTVSNHIFLGVPNSISEETVKETVDVVLQELEAELIKNDKGYNIPVGQKGKWIKYEITKEYPGGMPWEDQEEKKKKKQGSMVYDWHLSSTFIAQRSSALQSYLTAPSTSIYGKNTGEE
jgi:hypothetical protein